MLLFFLECLTYDGPPMWKYSPNECQFPFTYNGKTHKTCTTEGKSQPWCMTIVKKEGEIDNRYLR